MTMSINKTQFIELVALWVTNFKGEKVPFIENYLNYFRNNKILWL